MSTSVNITINVAGARLGGAVATVKLTAAQKATGVLMVWVGDEAIGIPLVHVVAKRRRAG